MKTSNYDVSPLNLDHVVTSVTSDGFYYVRVLPYGEQIFYEIAVPHLTRDDAQKTGYDVLRSFKDEQ